MKIVYLLDGTPFIAELNDEGEYVYPNDEWTEVSPPEGIYQPFYYDGNKWIGTSKEEWEKNNVIDPTPNETDVLTSELLLNDLKHEKEIEGLKQDIANLTTQLLLTQGGSTDVLNT